MKEGACTKGCGRTERDKFPMIGEPWHDLYGNGELSCTNHLVQCPDCAKVFYTYKDEPGPWGQKGPRYWRTIREGEPCI